MFSYIFLWISKEYSTKLAIGIILVYHHRRNLKWNSQTYLSKFNNTLSLIAKARTLKPEFGREIEYTFIITLNERITFLNFKTSKQFNNKLYLGIYKYQKN